MVAANQVVQGEQGVPAPEDEMKRIRDMVGAAVAYHVKPLMEKWAALESRFAEKPAQPPQPQMAQGGYPGQYSALQTRPQHEQISQAEAMYLIGLLQSQGYLPSQGYEQEPAKEDVDYSDVIEDMMDTLRDANKDMSRQEARAIAYDVIEEARRTGKEPEEVFAQRAMAEMSEAAQTKIFHSAAIGRLNRLAAKYGQQLTPLQQQQAQEAADQQAAVSAKQPAASGRGTQLTPIASRTPTHPPRATGGQDRDTDREKMAQDAINAIDSKG